MKNISKPGIKGSLAFSGDGGGEDFEEGGTERWVKRLSSLVQNETICFQSSGARKF
ncbi:hypothetical protein CTI12_AA412990 [Artemisia annua]|uniref:Uncharacterized protein n=1 Tax=Artemisia annua TaxID=35608 RepID=A0A2U1M6N5_ARTAN|nr:hypothetical protein CTI12_AA412990 [Artemisia annua]